MVFENQEVYLCLLNSNYRIVLRSMLSTKYIKLSQNKPVIMKNLFKCIVLLGILSVPGCTSQKEPVDYADPLMGTSESRWMLVPGVTMPFGMVQLSPDNQSNGWKTGYEYTISSISGFSHIHSWTMAGLSVMPTVGIINPRIAPPDAPTTTGTHIRLISL